MIVFFDDGEMDDGLHSLRRVLAALDAERLRIDQALTGVSEECHLHEEGDDLAGLGFVACQRYLTQVASQFGVGRKVALALGPRAASGETVASLVDAAANTWKHEAEWKEVLDRRQEATADRLAAELPDGGWDYKFLNALHGLCPDNRFATVAGLLEEWRDAVTGHPTPSKGGSAEDVRDAD